MIGCFDIILICYADKLFCAKSPDGEASFDKNRTYSNRIAESGIEESLNVDVGLHIVDIGLHHHIAVDGGLIVDGTLYIV